MNTTRLEAFSDGVIAIIITIMVLELKVPHGVSFAEILDMCPIFFSYLLSFIYVGIYWSNHHHLFHISEKLNGGILWANLHLLFWLSLIPFVTAWAGENHFSAAVPTAMYGGVLFFCGFAYSILTQALIRENGGKNSALGKAVGKDTKGIASVVIYAIAIPMAFIHSGIALGLYVCVAIMWVIPDRRIEKRMKD